MTKKLFLFLSLITSFAATQPLSAMQRRNAPEATVEPMPALQRCFFSGIHQRFLHNVSLPSMEEASKLFAEKLPEFLALRATKKDAANLEKISDAINELSFLKALAMQIDFKQFAKLPNELEQQATTFSQLQMQRALLITQEAFFRGLQFTEGTPIVGDSLLYILAFEAGQSLQEDIKRISTTSHPESLETSNPGGSPTHCTPPKGSVPKPATDTSLEGLTFSDLAGMLTEKDWAELESCGAGSASKAPTPTPPPTSTPSHKKLPDDKSIHFLNGFKFNCNDTENIERNITHFLGEYAQERSPEKRTILVHKIAFFCGLRSRITWNTTHKGAAPHINANDTACTELNFLSGFFNEAVEKITAPFAKEALDAGKNARATLQIHLKTRPQKAGDHQPSPSFRNGLKKGYLEEHLENVLRRSLWREASDALEGLQTRYMNLPTFTSTTDREKIIRQISYHAGIMRGSTCSNTNKWDLDDFIKEEETFSEETLQAKFMEGFENPAEDSPDMFVAHGTQPSLLVIAKGCGVIARQDIDKLIEEREKARPLPQSGTADRLRKKLEQKRAKTQKPPTVATETLVKSSEHAEASASPSICASTLPPALEEGLSHVEGESKKEDYESVPETTDHSTAAAISKLSASALKRAKAKTATRRREAATKIQSIARQRAAKNYALSLRAEKIARIAEEQNLVRFRVIQDAEELRKKESEDASQRRKTSAENKAKFDLEQAAKQKAQEDAARIEAERLKVQRIIEEHTAAATNIQRIFRGNHDRTHVAELRAQKAAAEERAKKAQEAADRLEAEQAAKQHVASLAAALEAARLEAAQRKAEADDLRAQLAALEQQRADEQATKARGDAEILKVFKQITPAPSSESTHSTRSGEDTSSQDGDAVSTDGSEPTEKAPYEMHPSVPLPYPGYQPHMIPYPMPMHFGPRPLYAVAGHPYFDVPMMQSHHAGYYAPGFCPRPMLARPVHVPGMPRPYTPPTNSFPPVRRTVPPPPKDWVAEGRRIYQEMPSPEGRYNWRHATLGAIKTYQERGNHKLAEINQQLLEGFDAQAKKA